MVPACLLAGLAACGTTAAGQVVTTSFADVHGLERGAPVVLQGVRIGEVGELAVEGDRVRVELRLRERHAADVHEGAVVMITRRAERAQVELFNPARESPPVAPGDALRGIDSPLGLVLWRAAEVAGSAGGMLDDASRAAREVLDSEAWEQARRELAESLAGISGQARQAVEQGTGVIDSALRELAAAIETMHREGAEEAARLLERLREELDAGEPSLPGPGPMPEPDPRPV